MTARGRFCCSGLKYFILFFTTAPREGPAGEDREVGLNSFCRSSCDTTDPGAGINGPRTRQSASLRKRLIMIP